MDPITIHTLHKNSKHQAANANIIKTFSMIIGKPNISLWNSIHSGNPYVTTPKWMVSLRGLGHTRKSPNVIEDEFQRRELSYTFSYGLFSMHAASIQIA